MKVAGGGFEPCDNGQLAVDMDSLLIGATDTVQACNDTQQVNPMRASNEPFLSCALREHRRSTDSIPLTFVG